MNLEWASAEVKDATLTVELTGDAPKGWKQSFERTVTLLGDGDWGEIQLRKGTVSVGDVPPGSEDKLRHHLEAIVAQANAAHEEEDDERGDGDEPEGPDAEMTDRFRAFAEDDDEAAENGG
ncbi:MAG TPA: hypothetical protein VLC49_07755 [Solirubrobacteraceae bacterium]|nr:hypothetical protein [Solirubrobacteraceae bacterium]